MNIFSTIWKKAFHKGESAFKLADDVGNLKGVFSYTPYDPITGQRFDKVTINNLLVNTSKSNIIRLISQGQSPWIGQIDPAELKISRMRFGNNNIIATNYPFPNKLHYYDPLEISSRVSTPLPQAGEGAALRFAGGLSTQDYVGADGLGTSRYASSNTNPAVYSPALNGCKKWPVTSITQDVIGQTKSANPPSHGTLQVKFYNSNVLIETLQFGVFPGTDSTVYTKRADGIPPVKIISESANVYISTPETRQHIDGKYVATPNSTQTNTRLIYDYTVGSRGWKLVLDEVASPAAYDRIDFTFEIGKHNIINSIVPRLGYNQELPLANYATMTAATANRFQGNQDWYPVLSAPEYRDAEADYIDDFSVTFGVNMSGQYGNGDATQLSGTYIRYKEAFLFNGRDDLFSAVYLPTAMDKNNGQAFYISWTILAPIS